MGLMAANLQSLVEYGRNANSFEIIWMSSLQASMKKIRLKMKNFLIITLWELSAAMETEFRSDLAQNLMQPFPHPYDALDRIWLR